jgi:hypothetical protein
VSSPPPKNILAAIGGSYIAAAIDQLPDPKTHEIQETVMEVPYLGKVRFRAELHHYKKHKTSWKAWNVFEAFKVEKLPEES